MSLFSPKEQRGEGRGALPDFLFSFLFPCPADHEYDWPPCKVVLFRVGNQYAECEKLPFRTTDLVSVDSRQRTPSVRIYVTYQLGTDPMAFDSTIEWMPSWKAGKIP